MSRGKFRVGLGIEGFELAVGRDALQSFMLLARRRAAAMLKMASLESVEHVSVQCEERRVLLPGSAVLAEAACVLYIPFFPQASELLRQPYATGHRVLDDAWLARTVAGKSDPVGRLHEPITGVNLLRVCGAKVRAAVEELARVSQWRRPCTTTPCSRP